MNIIFKSKQLYVTQKNFIHIIKICGAGIPEPLDIDYGEKVCSYFFPIVIFGVKSVFAVLKEFFGFNNQQR